MKEKACQNDDHAARESGLKDLTVHCALHAPSGWCVTNFKLNTFQNIKAQGYVKGVQQQPWLYQGLLPFG